MTNRFLKPVFLLLVVITVFSGCKKEEVIDEIKEVENVEVMENDNVKVENDKIKEEIDTSDWQTYRNEEFGFEVKYPKDWIVQKVKTSSEYPSLSPINCEKTPENCDFEMIQFISVDENNFVNVRKNSSEKFEKNIVGKKSFLMQDIIEGCLVVNSVKIGEKSFSLSSFMYSDNLSGLDKDEFDRACEKNELGEIVDLMSETIKVL